MKSVCPCCHRAMPAPRAAKPVTIDTASMTDAQLFAHYKKTSPAGDVEFFARHAILTSELRQAIDALRAALVANPTMARTEVFRRLTAIQDGWRRMPAEADVEVRHVA